MKKELITRLHRSFEDAAVADHFAGVGKMVDLAHSTMQRVAPEAAR